MTQKTVTEKDQFLQSFENESRTTLKILKALPEGKADFKPHHLSRTAKELASTFLLEQGLVSQALAGKIDLASMASAPPASYADVIQPFEKTSRETIDKVKPATDETLQRIVQFPVGPGKMGDFRAMDLLWFALHDQIHHRGQFSIYLRMTGAKVPSIYGPTADEPWM